MGASRERGSSGILMPLLYDPLTQGAFSFSLPTAVALSLDLTGECRIPRCGTVRQ
ncbi:MAG: hypothetical protein ISS56_14370 [Anaerolineae bacterium]|nr:hypothetical protein [Anaerolineae bacterium]